MAAEGKRRRRTPEETKRAILDAARARLAHLGPDGIRLADIAKDAGISHPTILHYFASRDGLVEALTEDVIADLIAGARSRLSRITDSLDEPHSLDAVYDAMVEGGYARLLAWLTISGQFPGPERIARAMAGLVDEVAALLAPRMHLPLDAARREARHTIELVVTAAIGAGLVGQVLGPAMGGEASGGAGFRAWLRGVFIERYTR